MDLEQFKAEVLEESKRDKADDEVEWDEDDEAIQAVEQDLLGALELLTAFQVLGNYIADKRFHKAVPLKVRRQLKDILKQTKEYLDSLDDAYFEEA